MAKSRETAFEFETPVLIAGAGAGGCVAALAAASQGSEVLVLEQDDAPRGTTAMSQGLICAAGTRSQREHGVEDSADVFFNDIITKTRGQTDQRLARAIADGAGPSLDWLCDQHDFPWTLDTSFRAVYGHSRTRVHGWAGRSGTDMINLLHARCDQAGVDMLLGARLESIIDDGKGRALGVEISRRDGSIERIGCRTLILATCGFGANHEMVARYMPEMQRARYNGHEGNRGDGIMLGAGLGGALADMGSYQGYGMLADPHGITLPPGVMYEGGVLLNSTGSRFVNEVEDIAGMVHPVLEQPGACAWVVYGQRIAAALAQIPEMQQLAALNAPRQAKSYAALGAIIGCDPRRVGRSFKVMRDAYLESRADPFGRSWRTDAPPEAPFYAIKVTGALYHTQGGLSVNHNARVLRADDNKLPNVFAVGGAARGVSGPSYWGYLPAMGLCAAITLGRAAGLAASRQAEQ